MTKPNQPTDEAILAALATLDAVTDWRSVVTDFDGVDARLAAVSSLACCLSGFAMAVGNDIDAVAYGEQKEAEKSDDEDHASEMFGNSLASNIQAAQAWCYAANVEESHDRFRDLETDIGRIPDSMTYEEYIAARDAI
jgi:hypothetical protein